MSGGQAALDKITDTILSYNPTGQDDEKRGAKSVGSYTLHLADAFAWLEAREENSIHAIVTDPPYGLKEYTEIEKAKLRKGSGGVWRIQIGRAHV